MELESVGKGKKRGNPSASADGPKRRGRPPKPVDLYAAIECWVRGASIRDMARHAGCCPKTLMGRYAEQLERAQARSSVFVKARLFEMAVKERNIWALLFLGKQMLKHYERREESDGQMLGDSKWSRSEFTHALRLVALGSQRAATKKYNRRSPRQTAPPYQGGL